MPAMCAISASKYAPTAARDFAHPLEIDDARVSARADSDHLRPMFPRHLCELIVIDPFVIFANTVMDDFKKLAGEIRFIPVRQMPAVSEIHRQHFVARLEQGEIDRHIGATAGVRLDIGVFGAEKFLRPIDRQLFNHVDVFTTPVPALSRIAFGILIRQHRALGFHHGGAGEIFAGNEFDVLLLALAS